MIPVQVAGLARIESKSGLILEKVVRVLPSGRTVTIHLLRMSDSGAQIRIHKERFDQLRRIAES